MAIITVLGIGSSRVKYRPYDGWRVMAAERPLYLPTLNHPLARYLTAEKGVYSLGDSLKDRGKLRRSLAMAKRLARAARKHGAVTYASPASNPGQDPVVVLLNSKVFQAGISVRLAEPACIPESLLSCLKLGPLEGITFCNLPALNRLSQPLPGHLVLAGANDGSSLAEAVRKLLQVYPPDHRAVLVGPAPVTCGRLWEGPISNLHQALPREGLDLVCLEPYRGGAIGDLLAVMARLRSAQGCPWDRRQDHYSLRQYLVEEAYEVVAAIEKGDDSALREELGDLLLQVVFHSQIAGEEGRFDFNGVVASIVAKLERRHPHVFGEAKAKDAAEVKLLWDEIKAGERGVGKQALSVDHALPALLKAYKLQKRAAEMGFDWTSIEGPLDKAREEIAELEAALAVGDRQAVEEEVGDYLFTAVNISRFLNVNPELALGKTITKFGERFSYVLKRVEETGRPLSEFSLEELDNWWEEAKKIGN